MLDAGYWLLDAGHRRSGYQVIRGWGSGDQGIRLSGYQVIRMEGSGYQETRELNNEYRMTNVEYRRLRICVHQRSSFDKLRTASAVNGKTKPMSGSWRLPRPCGPRNDIFDFAPHSIPMYIGTQGMLWTCVPLCLRPRL